MRLENSDGDGRGRHVVARLEYPKRLIDTAGLLLASGPLEGLERRNGFLILAATWRAEAEALIAADPFAIGDLIVDLRIEQWDPLFGAFADRSSRVVSDVLRKSLRVSAADMKADVQTMELTRIAKFVHTNDV